MINLFPIQLKNQGDCKSYAALFEPDYQKWKKLFSIMFIKILVLVARLQEKSG